MKMSKVLLLLIASLGILSSGLKCALHHGAKYLLNNLLDMHHKDAFKVWHFIHNKDYDLNSEYALERYQIFKENIQKIKARNGELTSYKLGAGPHADLTNEEYKLKFFPVSSKGKFNLSSQFHDNTEKLPSAINPYKEDWSVYFGPVRDQGMCGSCWAFATSGAIEGYYSKLTGKYEKLSPQYLIDCSKENKGCDGGDFDPAFDFIKKSGIPKDNDYPYKATGGKCKADSINDFFHIDYVLYCNDQDDNAKNKCTEEKCSEYLKYSPLATGIDGSSFEFQMYMGGIFEGECSEANHAVIIVDSNNEYIKIRNSWGPGWGEDGYIKIRRNKENNSSCFTQSICYAAMPISK